MRIRLGLLLGTIITFTVLGCGNDPVVKSGDNDTSSEGGASNETTGKDSGFDLGASGGGEGDDTEGGDGDETGAQGGVSDGCGDSEIDDGEECDDGNTEDGDGCSSKCEEEAGFTCVAEGAACEECGNGVLESSEECDDDNRDNNDGCSSKCKVEDGFQCEQGFGCFNCGNKKIEGSELCDNGLHCIDDEGEVAKECSSDDDCTGLGDELCLPRSGDGCDEDCTGSEVGFSCYEDGSCEECGDGKVDPNEACDDGNRFSADGCQFNCQLVEEDFVCPEEGGPCKSCGNGWLEADEACDDGNREDGDGCNSTCSKKEDGFLCVVQGRACYQCGNGIQEGSFDTEHETCDDGSQCENGEQCSIDADCENIGDGLCTARAGDGCDLNCQLETDQPWVCPIPGEPCLSCGNGTIESGDIIGEECDDGNSISGDGCSNFCRLEAGAVCSPAVPTAPEGQNCIVCGDSQIEGGEECDDGDRFDRNGCSASCQIEAIEGKDWTCPNNDGVGGKCSFCGNGVQEAGEDCDDGNGNTGDGCDASCKVETGWTCGLESGRLRSSCDKCGNSRRKFSEECDDGNTQDGDGCSGACKIESNEYNCPSTGGVLCNNCGDGVVDGLEVCDEGHDITPSNKTSGCSDDCYSVTSDWYCRENGAPCEQCGDGVVDPHEKCDDGNALSGDGCRSDCLNTESGWLCTINQENTTVCSRCGNGILNDDPNDTFPDEECDDGNSKDGDGCTQCKVDNNYSCYPNDSEKPKSRSLCERCGNGIVRGPFEECDDKNLDNTDGCSSTCQEEGGNWICPEDGGQCRNCGNGTLEKGEVCDEGPNNGTVGCDQCTNVTDDWTCPSVNSSCIRCGDGQIDAPYEACDDGPTDSPVDGDGCTADCRQIEENWLCPQSGGACSRCGNGIIDDNADDPNTAAETCDDGNQDPNDGCNSACQLEGPPFYCDEEGVACEKCGDGIKNPNEGCDDGNLATGDGCSDSCDIEGSWSCPLPNLPCNLCGDGILQGTEQCDDAKHCANGNECDTDDDCATSNGDRECRPRANDGCTDCKVDPGYTCEQVAVTSGPDPEYETVCSSLGCGDGYVAGQEECDDGNSVSTDGCNSRCEIEDDYACPPTGGACEADFCGDTIVGSNEQCDDGMHCSDGEPCLSADDCADPSLSDNLCIPRDDDGCQANCQLLRNCGDGVVGGDEECDFNSSCSNDLARGCSSDDDCEDGGLCLSAADKGCVDCAIESGAVCPDIEGNAGCLSDDSGLIVDACGAGSLYRNNSEECDDGNDIDGDGCSACVIDDLSRCSGEVGQLSKCSPIFKWALVRTFNVSSISPEAIHFDPTRRSFVGYKGSPAQNILELCLDGTYLNHPYKNEGFVCLPSGTCTDYTEAQWPLDHLRGYPVSYSSTSGATYDPISGKWLFLDSDYLFRTDFLSMKGEAQGNVEQNSIISTSAIEKGNGTGIAIGDDGRLYMTIEKTSNPSFVGIRAFDRDENQPAGFDLSMATGTWTVNGDEVLNGVVALSGAGAVAIFNDVADSSPLDDGYTDLRAYDISTDNATFGVSGIAGNMFADKDVFGNDVPIDTLISTVGTGMETSTDGSGFIICTASSGSCYLFAQTCETNDDCQSGATCQPGLAQGAPSYCAAPGKARDDYESTSKNGSTEVDVLLNDTRSEGTCRDSTFAVKDVGTCALGGEVSLGDENTCIESENIPCVIYEAPSDGTCNIIDSCDYTLDLGTDGDDNPLTDTATIRVTVSCTCGNGELDPGEQCDDPDDSACGSDCRLIATCGNGIEEGDETCDDGNKLNGDGCAWNCRLEGCGNGIIEEVNGQLEECDSTPGCRADCTRPECTDGILDPGEACDDGNLDDNDGCSNNCEIVPICGDGELDDTEMCDDGNDINNDACRNDCTPAICGDGIKTDLEDCDDGNNLSGDGCSWNCFVESCGDNILDESSEACDDGNNVDGDGCSALCTIEECGNDKIERDEDCDGTDVPDGKTCRADCTIIECGDGILDDSAGETCDDGNTLSDDGCSSTCEAELFCGDGKTSPEIGEDCDWSDDATADGCTLNCEPIICGDGKVDEGEQCDDFANSDPSDGCRSDCTVPFCGDGEVDDFDGEECDDENFKNGDGCSIFCLIEAVCGNGEQEPGEECDGGSDCSASCTLVGCGNGEKDESEDCDPSAPDAPDNCRNDCTLAVCGDGIFDPNEECDDGGDSTGCTADCKLKTDCGDKIREETEECDDGNKVNGDGCSSVCRWEYCGNGVLDTAGDNNEECDDGNNMSGDGCSSTCQKEAICGDDKREGNEQCDDGNMLDGDGCSKTCRIEAYCGNGKVEAGEECDDGPQGSIDCTVNCNQVIIR